MSDRLQQLHSILVINPNSSVSVTEGLRETLVAPPGIRLDFFTAPKEAPPAINDITTGNLSATYCFDDLHREGLIDKYDGFLVCCFSDHPLTHMLRESTTKPAVGILETAVTHALLVGRRFGVITTGTGYNFERWTEVNRFLGSTSERFAGVAMTGLGVVELRVGDRKEVEASVKAASAEIAKAGADAILLGCAGMAGMESLVKEGAGKDRIHIIDGAKAGVEFLAGIIRLRNAS